MLEIHHSGHEPSICSMLEIWHRPDNLLCHMKNKRMKVTLTLVLPKWCHSFLHTLFAVAHEQYCLHCWHLHHILLLQLSIVHITDKVISLDQVNVLAVRVPPGMLHKWIIFRVPVVQQHITMEAFDLVPITCPNYNNSTDNNNTDDEILV